MLGDKISIIQAHVGYLFLSIDSLRHRLDQGTSDQYMWSRKDIFQQFQCSNRRPEKKYWLTHIYLQTLHKSITCRLYKTSSTSLSLIGGFINKQCGVFLKNVSIRIEVLCHFRFHFAPLRYVSPRLARLRHSPGRALSSSRLFSSRFWAK